MSTVYRAAITDLGGRIVRGDLEPGTVLTLEQLGRECEVSRTIAREVVQVLSSMGLVESRRRTGVTVLPVTRWDSFAPAVIRWRLEGPERHQHLVELSQLRAAVEPAATALAATRADDATRATLAELAEQLEETGARGDLASFLTHDVLFHRTLLVASGNPMFAGLGDVVEEVLRGRTDHHLMPPEPKPEARRLHAVVAEAVGRGEGDVARAAMSTICVEVSRGIAEMDPARTR